jgi:hypothetical protein
LATAKAAAAAAAAAKYFNDHPSMLIPKLGGEEETVEGGMPGWLAEAEALVPSSDAPSSSSKPGPDPSPQEWLDEASRRLYNFRDRLKPTFKVMPALSKWYKKAVSPSENLKIINDRYRSETIDTPNDKIRVGRDMGNPFLYTNNDWEEAKISLRAVEFGSYTKPVEADKVFDAGDTEYYPAWSAYSTSLIWCRKQYATSKKPGVKDATRLVFVSVFRQNDQKLDPKDIKWIREKSSAHRRTMRD